MERIQIEIHHSTSKVSTSKAWLTFNVERGTECDTAPKGKSSPPHLHKEMIPATYTHTSKYFTDAAIHRYNFSTGNTLVKEMFCKKQCQIVPENILHLSQACGIAVVVSNDYGRIE